MARPRLGSWTRHLLALPGCVVLTLAYAPSPTLARYVAPAGVPSGTSYCTAAQKGTRLAALRQYRRTMKAARRRYFRNHPTLAARRRFVAHQEARLRALEHAARCSVLPAGARIARRIHVPGDGPVTLDERNLWVVDRADGAADAAGTPLGVLYRLDPQSGALLGETRGVSGGDVASGFGGVWLAAFGFNSVFRVDWGTSAVTRVPTGVDDQGPAGVALAPTGVWVTNHHGGSLVKLDFAHGAVLKTLQLVPPGPDGPSAVAYDGTHLWVAVAGSSQLVELDEATGAATARYAIRAGTCGGLALGEGQVWVAGGECGSTRLSVLELSSGQVKALPIPHAVDAVVAFGSVWVLAGWPARLVRLQPYTYDVLGVMPLPAAGWNLEASADGLWVRVQNALLRVAPS